MTFKTPGIEFIRNEMDWDTHDAWGSVQSARFDLAGAQFVFSGERLGEFEPGPGYRLSGRAKRIYGAMNDGIIGHLDVCYWDRVLDQMYDLVKLAGRDY